MKHTDMKKQVKFLINPVRLFNRNFFLLLQGQLVSNIGTHVYDIAMILFIKETTGMATLMGLLLMASHIPDVLIGPVAGTLIDRLPRKKVIVIADFASGAAVLVIVLLIALIPHETTIILCAIFIVAILLGGFLGFLSPAITASIPNVVPLKKLKTANSIMSSSEEGSVFIGQALGGILYSFFGAALSFLVNAISYLFSSITEMFISLPEKHLKRNQNKITSTNFKKDLKGGFEYVWKNKGLRNSVMIVALQNFFLAPIIILLPFYVDLNLHLGPEWFGFLLAIYSLGNIAGYIIAGFVSIPGKIRAWIILGSHIIIFSLVILVGNIHLLVLSLVCIFIIGVFSGFTDVNILTILQLTTPDRLRGRVFGLLGSISKLLVPIGMGLTGIVLDSIGRNAPPLFIGIGTSALFLSFFIFKSKDFRTLLGYEFKGESK